MKCEKCGYNANVPLNYFWHEGKEYCRQCFVKVTQPICPVCRYGIYDRCQGHTWRIVNIERV